MFLRGTVMSARMSASSVKGRTSKLRTPQRRIPALASVGQESDTPAEDGRLRPRG